MTQSIFYLDSSAILKLATLEAETQVLYEWWNSAIQEDIFVVSEIAKTEVIGNAMRISPAATKTAENILAKLSLIRLTTAILTRATNHVSQGLRTLDAIHLSSAESLSVDAITLVAYDKKFLSYVKTKGLNIFSPK